MASGDEESDYAYSEGEEEEDEEDYMLEEDDDFMKWNPSDNPNAAPLAGKYQAAVKGLDTTREYT